MRWMEALVERAGAAGALPTIQKLWAAERSHPTIEPVGNPLYAPGRLNRILNLVLALAALTALLPVLLLIALLIRVTSRGPIFYTQVRVGLDRRAPLDLYRNHRRERDLGGRPFTIY
ncbi:MAG TPA: sugar transferase, partial [Gemmatimonadales bacterium]|nr:sugar transferase [Gemmatimonadales bacterium]